MSQGTTSIFLLSIFALDGSAMAAFLLSNMSRSHCAKDSAAGLYGKNECPCVGIDNLKGYYATQQNFYHVQYPAEAGASCAAWEDGMHPKCRDGAGPQWCKQQWCYVDPCKCNLDVPPKKTGVNVEYQGGPAFWSYKTCGSVDFWSQDMDPDACVLQKSAGACSSKSKCAWDGKTCGDKKAVDTCAENSKADAATYGEEDCRCVGFGGRDVGSAFMYVNDQDLATYPANVGATCKAWEMDAHPDCKKDGAKPSWCSAKWCFVDPCKCKAKVPPKTVMKANSAMRFQGKTAYWSYATCGSTDEWSTSHESLKYCNLQKSEAACAKVDKCAWDGKTCVGKALAELCKAQEDTGVLGLEAPLSSGVLSRTSAPIILLLAASVVAA